MTETINEQTISERIDKLVDEAQALLSEIEDEGATALEEATARSWERVRQYRGAADALEDDAARAESLLREREGLPTEHSRAVLVEDEAAAQRIKQRYTEIEQELEAIEERRPRLEDRVRELGGPNTQRLPRHLRSDGALLHQQRSVTAALDPTLQRLSLLDKEVCVPVKNAFGRVKAKATEVGSVSTEISNNIHHDPELSRQRRETALTHVNTARAARSRGR